MTAHITIMVHMIVMQYQSIVIRWCHQLNDHRYGCCCYAISIYCHCHQKPLHLDSGPLVEGALVTPHWIDHCIIHLFIIFTIITILSVSTNQLVLSVCHRICIVSYTQVCIVSYSRICIVSYSQVCIVSYRQPCWVSYSIGSNPHSQLIFSLYN